MSNVHEIETVAMTVTEKVKSIAIADSESYQQAAAFWKEIKEIRSQVAATFDPIIKKAHEAHKQAVAKKKEVDAPLEAAQRQIKRLMADYDAEQERKRREEEERLRELARKEEEERRLKEAEAAEAAGMEDAVEAILDAPIETPTVVVQKNTPKVEGVIYRTIWKFRITNPELIPREYLKVDEVKIGQVVRALKDKTKINGVEVYAERV